MPTIEELKMLQSLPLDIKILKTKLRIKEWVEFWGKDGVYISFSGGKDSTVLLDLVRSEYPDIEAVFVDTGLEYPEIKEFVKTFDNLTILRPKLSFREVIEKYGFPVISKEVSECVSQARKGIESNGKYYSYRLAKLKGEAVDKYGNKSMYNQEKYGYLLDAPFKISNQCCNVMKKNPVKAYANKTGKKPITGQTADESRLRQQQWLKNSCNGFDMKSPISNPLGFWTEQDILKYIYENKLRIASVYGEVVQTDLMGECFELTGVKRTGCMFCMFGVHLEKEPNRFQRMKKTHPAIYDYCIRDTGLGIGKILDFIGIKY